MAYEDKTKALPAAPHRLTMDERQTLWMTGVEEVVSFDESEVSIRTVQGLLSVRGTGLKVDKLEKTSGELTISGMVTDLDYQEAGPHQGFWSRLFR
ncbi:MAG: sporulation protein YabP [Oscillospiraceae bacterium]|nr:sporulation protein YabP [Oscillospiraceae bacterium]